MKRFKAITVFTTAALAVLFAVHLYCLYTLYGSVKEQALQVASQCFSRADVREMIERARNFYEIRDGDTLQFAFRLPVRISADSTRTLPAYDRLAEDAVVDSTGYYNLFESLFKEIAKGMHGSFAEADVPTDYAVLDSLFRAELNVVRIHPETAFAVPADSVVTGGGRVWEVPYAVDEGGEAVYKVYISPLYGYLLSRMAGLVSTTLLIMAVLVFALCYLIRTVVRLRTLEEMKDDFTHNMTHELKTPLAIAYSANDALLNYTGHDDLETHRRYLTVALEQLARLGEMIDNILSVSMERQRTLVLRKEPVKVFPLVEELAEHQKLRSGKPVEVEIDVVPHDLAVDTDARHFANVVNNLLDNAVKYSGERVKVTVRATAAGLSVSDDGIGIPAESLPLVFDRFYRVPQGNRQEVRGYGIGLYYVKSMVEKMGWRISVESKLHVGSTFTIRFNENHG